jgi:hypothetical protein
VIPEATNFFSLMVCVVRPEERVRVARLVRIGTIDFYCHSFDPPPTDDETSVALVTDDKTRRVLLAEEWKKIEEETSSYAGDDKGTEKFLLRTRHQKWIQGPPKFKKVGSFRKRYGSGPTHPVTESSERKKKG